MSVVVRYETIPSDIRVAINKECLKRDYDEERVWELMGSRTLYCKTCNVKYPPDYAVYTSIGIMCPVCDSSLLQEIQKSTPTLLKTSGESMAIQIKDGYYEAIPHELVKSICELVYVYSTSKTQIEEILQGRQFCCARCKTIYTQHSAYYLRDRIMCARCDMDLLIETIVSTSSKKNKENEATHGESMEKSTQVNTKFSQDEYIKYIQTLGRTYGISPEEVEKLRQEWAEEACIQTTFLSLDAYIKLSIKLREAEHHKFIKLTLAECRELMDLLINLQDRFEKLNYLIDAGHLSEQIEQLEDHISNHTFEDDSSLVRVVPADAHRVTMITPEDDELFTEKGGVAASESLEDEFFTSETGEASPT